MKQSFLKMISLTASLLMLTGCFFQSPDNLYAIPKAPDDFNNLDQIITEVLRQGAEYAAPIQGVNSQPVQLLDLDGDGRQEALAFFRMTSDSVGSTGQKPLKICIYRQTEDDSYAVQAVIEDAGTAINSISYVDVDGNNDKELVVVWQYSTGVSTLAVYSVHGGQVTEYMRAPYSDYVIQDIDRDNRQEIITLWLDGIEGNPAATFYDFSDTDGAMVPVGIVPLSKGIKEFAVSGKRTGYLQGNIPALFITSTVSDGSGVITDILAWRNGMPVNLTLDPATGRSDETQRMVSGVGIRDINGDGILELPRPFAFPPKPDATVRPAGPENFFSIHWVQYDIAGAAHEVYTTYNNDVDGWYLVLPDAWNGKITLARQDSVGERAVIFYKLDEDNPMDNPRAFLAIYKLTGVNRDSRAKYGSRFPLVEPLEGDTYYVAQFLDTAIPGEETWDCGLDQESLKALFHQSQPEWTGAS